MSIHVKQIHKFIDLVPIVKKIENLSNHNNYLVNIYCKDINGFYLACNESQSEMFGHGFNKKIIGKTDLDLPMEIKFSSKIRQNDLAVIEHQKKFIFEETVIVDNKEITCLSNKHPFFNQNGQIIGIWGISSFFGSTNYIPEIIYPNSDADEEKILTLNLRSLSFRELQVALMITEGEKVIEISNKLHMSPKTVHSYRYRIFEKLNVKSNTQLAVLVVKSSYISQIVKIQSEFLSTVLQFLQFQGKSDSRK